MNFTFELSEAHDSEAPPELRGRIAQGGLQSGGFSTMAVGFAHYAHTRRRAQFAGSAQTAFRYYQELDLVDPVSHGATLDADLKLSSRVSLRLDQSGAYSPSYLYQLFPTTLAPALGDGIIPAPDYRVVQTDSYQYQSRATITVGSTSGTSVSASGEYDRTRFEQTIGGRPNLEVSSGSAKMSQRIRRNVHLSGEYEYRAAEFGDQGRSTEHRLTFGADYSRALSSSRRANFRLEVTPSTLELPPAVTPTDVSGPVFRLQGEAAVEYQLGRTWRASGSGRREVQYLIVLNEPVYSNSARVVLEGLVTRRIDVAVTAAYATGASAVTQSSQIETYSGDAKVRFALTRSFAVYTEYLYLYYDLRGYQQITPELPRIFRQHGVRVGLTLWTSAF